MLALADRNGVVDAALPGLANAARVTVEECSAALEKFKQPDKFSRSKSHDGRRIEEIEGGWRLFNYEFYRKKLSADERREYKAAWMAASRSKDKRKHQKNTGLDGKPASEGYKEQERIFTNAVQDGATPEQQNQIITNSLPKAAQ